LLIVDEAHRLKSGRADRTKQVFGGIKRDANNHIVERIKPIRANRRVFLTGTPVLNGKPKELWPLLRSIDPDGLGRDWFAFAKRYCDLLELTRFDPSKGKEVHVGWKWDGATNLEEMQEAMRKKFMIRRLKSDVLKQLPEKRRMVIPLVANRAQKKLIKEELQAFEQWANGRDIDDLEMPEFGDFATAMKELGLSMVEPAIEVIENELESINKLVVFCYHNDVSKKMHEAFPDSLLINGFVAPNDRFEISKQFQNDPNKRLLIGTIGSAGEGLTLTAASTALFVERSWQTGAMTQAEDRIHRRGQQLECLYKHLVLKDSLSERQVKALLVKQDKNDRILDGKN
jgi:SWI/SNF-related matrix-associated actin-dependent regulator 1 of chromatin subfamily A